MERGVVSTTAGWAPRRIAEQQPAEAIPPRHPGRVHRMQRRSSRRPQHSGRRVGEPLQWLGRGSRKGTGRDVSLPFARRPPMTLWVHVEGEAASVEWRRSDASFRIGDRCPRLRFGIEHGAGGCGRTR